MTSDTRCPLQSVSAVRNQNLNIYGYKTVDLNAASQAVERGDTDGEGRRGRGWRGWIKRDCWVWNDGGEERRGGEETNRGLSVVLVWRKRKLPTVCFLTVSFSLSESHTHLYIKFSWDSVCCQQPLWFQFVVCWGLWGYGNGWKPPPAA